MRNKQPSEWRVSANPVGGRMLYGAYRIRNMKELDHSGNRETRGVLFADRTEAEEFVKYLNEEEGE